MPLSKLLCLASTPISAAVGGLFLALFSAPAAATLHGYCGSCIDNGTTVASWENPIFPFGFTSSTGPVTGDLFIDVLVPNNPVNNPTTLKITLTGTLSGTATLFSSSAWTSGNLAAYLGTPIMGAEPANPIGAFLSRTQRGATGFFVYQADLGTTTLQGLFDRNQSPLENISTNLGCGALPWHSAIVGFFNDGTATNPHFQATENNGAIFLPEPASLLLLGTGLLGLGVSRRRRRN